MMKIKVDIPKKVKICFKTTPFIEEDPDCRDCGHLNDCKELLRIKIYQRDRLQVIYGLKDKVDIK